jgi:hypothetical protein
MHAWELHVDEVVAKPISGFDLNPKSTINNIGFCSANLPSVLLTRRASQRPKSRRRPVLGQGVLNIPKHCFWRKSIQWLLGSPVFIPALGTSWDPCSSATPGQASLWEIMQLSPVTCWIALCHCTINARVGPYLHSLTHDRGSVDTVELIS